MYPKGIQKYSKLTNLKCIQMYSDLAKGFQNTSKCIKITNKQNWTKKPNFHLHFTGILGN